MVRGLLCGNQGGCVWWVVWMLNCCITCCCKMCKWVTVQEGQGVFSLCICRCVSEPVCMWAFWPLSSSDGGWGCQSNPCTVRHYRAYCVINRALWSHGHTFSTCNVCSRVWEKRLGSHLIKLYFQQVVIVSLLSMDYFCQNKKKIRFNPKYLHDN